MIIDVTGTLCIQYSVRHWCKLPYPGHPKGCPNYGKSDVCPPKVCFVSEFIDLNMDHYFVVEKFDLGSFAKSMKEKHPHWSDKQCKCCLYWQNGVRKRLKSKCSTFIQDRPGYIYTLIPEAMGVNVFQTAHRHNLMISRKNPIVVYKIALVGKQL